MPAMLPNPATIPNPKGWGSLGLITVTVLVLWTCVLPQLSSWQPIRARIEFLDQNGIDPTALYYTDLKSMDRVEASVTATRQANPEAFWSIK